MKKFFFLFLIAIQLGAAQIETFYGPLQVDEPVLLELIASAPFQRLKKLHQYGVSYYTTYPEEYNRYDHSVGVFAILRVKGLSLKEQIAGLLHDVSHTAFSHVGDYVFKVALEKDSYQDGIHEWYLNNCGIGAILKRHGYEVKDVLPKAGHFLALERELPDLCADRIDYNLQGAFYRGFLSKKEAKEVLDGLKFDGKDWIAPNSEALRKMARFAIFMTLHCWGSAENYVSSNALSKALLRGVETGLIASDEILFGADNDLWRKLKESEDPAICEAMKKALNPNEYFSLSEEAERIRMKFRGVDPWVAVKGGKRQRLTAADSSFAEEYRAVKTQMGKGWPIKEKNTLR